MLSTKKIGEERCNVQQLPLGLGFAVGKVFLVPRQTAEVVAYDAVFKPKRSQLVFSNP